MVKGGNGRQGKCRESGGGTQPKNHKEKGIGVYSIQELLSEKKGVRMRVGGEKKGPWVYMIE